MKTNKSGSFIKAFFMSGLVVLFAACNGNGTYTKNPAGGPETPGNNDTSMNNVNKHVDTSVKSPMGKSSSSMAAKKHMTATKKGHITVGSISAKRTASMKPDKNGVYQMTEVRPSYPGGHAALQDYINNHIDYSQAAIDNNSEGTVDVQFVVDEKGNVTNAKAVGKELNSDLDDEAVRVVSNMPKWTPGKVRGKNVRARVVLPITYKIEQ